MFSCTLCLFILCFIIQATLRANIAGHEVSTVVSTSYLNITLGQILHRLTARAIISDWEDGVLSPDRTDHEVYRFLPYKLACTEYRRAML